MIEIDDKLCCSEADIQKAENGPFWHDCLALINGQIAIVTQKLCLPEYTETLGQVKALQESRANLLAMCDLPDMIRAEIEEQEQKEKPDAE